MPPRKMHRGTGKPCLSQTAKDGTVWVEEDIGMPSAVANHSCFTAQAGPTESAKHKITSVLQSFLCLLDVGMLQTIRECTIHQPRRTEPDWNLAIHELMALIFILFVRAIMCSIGAIVNCWSESFLVPVLKETMPRDRFISIMQHLRFDDKDTRAERVKTDKFAAISDIWTRFNKNCAESFTPGEHMTIDEQLFPTKVRCPFTQYIATKPDKFGIKFWMATDLETKYVCNASPYLGKDLSHQSRYFTVTVAQTAAALLGTANKVRSLTSSTCKRLHSERRRCRTKIKLISLDYNPKLDHPVWSVYMVTMERGGVLGVSNVCKEEELRPSEIKGLLIDFRDNIVDLYKVLGLSLPLCQWVSNFLTDKRHAVRMGKHTSSALTLSTGAPQGCVLSPLLYSVPTPIMFADETVAVGLISNNDETAYLQEIKNLER
ncbi:dual specificity protein phosphatase 26 isoform X1 [Silurus asotus]|uniref:Dual specificity protein phosphatase 26 isoform X1 n=1 Tax=Silurus asotus TaxID=30991 RepID=A0AAD5AM58_SILAS|nr:dual specificity protein phosphatase 26 isoform X1 [Silurus asotus]